MSGHNTHDDARRYGARPMILSACALAAALAAALAVAAAAAGAQSMRSAIPNVWLRPELGAYIPTGQQRNLLENAVLVGAQAQWDLTPRWALTGSYAWTPTHDRTTASGSNPLFLGNEARLNVSQWDVGAQAYLAGASPSLEEGDWYVRPFVGAGLGDRMYNYGEKGVVTDLVGSSSATDPAAYGALGTDLSMGGSPVGLHLELRDDVSRFKGTYAQLPNQTTRNDVTLSAGLNVGF